MISAVSALLVAIYGSCSRCALRRPMRLRFEQLPFSSFRAQLQALTIIFLSQMMQTATNYDERLQTMTNNSLAMRNSPVDFAPMLTGAQIRAARALLKWSGRELADRSGVSYPALQRAEAVDDMPNMQTRNLAAIKSALESGGVIFLDTGDARPGGPGVRLRQPGA